MLDKKYFRLANNADLQTSYIFSVIVTLLAVGKHSDFKYKNAKVGGNGDHTSNAAVAHMKAYKSVKNDLQLTLINQKWGGDLQILITEVINCSHIYEMTPMSLWG